MELQISTQHQLTGLHHVSAITSSAQRIYAFFTDILGLRLVNKTINSDDYTSYELYFADNNGKKGTILSFFDFPNSEKAVAGTHCVEKIAFLVADDVAVDYWAKRFEDYNITHGTPFTLFGRKTLEFQDFDGQTYRILSEETLSVKSTATPWENANVEEKYAILGIGMPTLKVVDPAQLDTLLQNVFAMKPERTDNLSTLYTFGEGGNNACFIVEKDETTPAQLGFGAIHHLAFTLEKDPNDAGELEGIRYWKDRFHAFHLPFSNIENRYFFVSCYAQVAPQIVFEIACDTHDFWDNEEAEKTAGETLYFPENLFPTDEVVRINTAVALAPLDTHDANEKRIQENAYVDND